MSRPLLSLAWLLTLAVFVAGPVAAALPMDLAAPAPAPIQSSDDDGPPQQESLLPDAANATIVLEDPENDAQLGLPFVGGPGGLGTDLDAAIDIVTISVAETESHLLVSLKHRAYPETMGVLLSTGFLSYWYCGLVFSPNGDDRRYDIGMQMDYDTSSAPYSMQAELYTSYATHDDNWDSEYFGQIPIALVANDHIEVVIDKALIGVGSQGRPLQVGDEIEQFYVWCGAGTGPTYAYDWAEGMSEEFVVQQAAGTTDLALSFPSAVDAVSAVTVAAGRVSKVPLRVENLLDRKALVNLTATIVDANGAPLAGWNVTNVGTLEIKAESGFDATLLIGAPASAGHRDGGFVRVVARPIGSEEPAIVTRAVQAVVTPSPSNNVLYFHNGLYDYHFCIPFCGDVPVPALVEGQYQQLLLNVLPVDPLYGETTTEDPQPAVLTTTYFEVTLDAPVAERVRFDPDGASTLTLSLRRDIETVVEATVYMEAFSSDGEYVNLMGSASGTIGTTYTPLTITMPHQFDELELQPGSSFWMSVELTYPNQPITLTYLGVGETDLDPAGSTFALALLDVPLTALEQSDGTVLPSLYLEDINATDGEYVNFGESKAFELILANEGTFEDVLTVTAEIAAPGWKVAFDPGASFKLKPGSAAPLCLTVTAPKSAKEGETALVNVSARAAADPAIFEVIELLVIATDGIDIDDDPCAEIEAEDFVKPYTPPPEDTPALGLPLVVLGVVGALAMLRRRRAA